jgi:hypothetical protein
MAQREFSPTPLLVTHHQELDVLDVEATATADVHPSRARNAR